MSGQERKDELLANMVVIDCGREWYCRLCSETNVWSRAKCRRCKTDIPAGLHGKHLQAVSTRNARSWSATSSGDGADHMLAYQAHQRNRLAKVARHSRWRAEDAVQFEGLEEDAKSEEDGRMKMDVETKS